MDWIILQLFELPSLLDGHEAAQERASNPDLNWLRQVCLAAEEDARLDESLTRPTFYRFAKVIRSISPAWPMMRQMRRPPCSELAAL